MDCNDQLILLFSQGIYKILKILKKKIITIIGKRLILVLLFHFNSYTQLKYYYMDYIADENSL